MHELTIIASNNRSFGTWRHKGSKHTDPNPVRRPTKIRIHGRRRFSFSSRYKYVLYNVIFLIIIPPSETGQLWTWGRGIFGQLGHGDQENRNKPKLVETAPDVKFIQVSCGSDFTVALSGKFLCCRWHALRVSLVRLDQGKVYTWGKGRQGALGHGDKNNQSKPKVVESLTDKIIVCVTAGSNFIIAVAGTNFNCKE